MNTLKTNSPTPHCIQYNMSKAHIYKNLDENMKLINCNIVSPDLLVTSPPGKLKIADMKPNNMRYETDELCTLKLNKDP